MDKIVYYFYLPYILEGSNKANMLILNPFHKLAYIYVNHLFITDFVRI